MSQDVMIIQEDKVIEDLKKLDTMCQFLMRTAHYKKIGGEGIFAIVQKAKILGIHPLEALNGSLYYVQGKVEMSSQIMAQLIRQDGNSIQKDPKSDDTICILHGKRKDNGDQWTESFSIVDAKRAGIYKENGPWAKYPRNMLYSRALSNLARQLFPDVIKGCYVEGEIRDAPPLFSGQRYEQPAISCQKINNQPEISEQECIQERIDADQLQFLQEAFEEFPDYKEQVMAFMAQHKGLSDVKDFPLGLFPKISKKIDKLREEKELSKIEDNMTAEDYMAAQGE